MLSKDSGDNNELVSIIVSVYNAEKFIERTVGFITAQTYSNIEIILVNDGSTDNTRQILNELAESDTRIKIINDILRLRFDFFFINFFVSLSLNFI